MPTSFASWIEWNGSQNIVNKMVSSAHSMVTLRFSLSDFPVEAFPEPLDTDDAARRLIIRP